MEEGNRNSRTKEREGMKTNNKRAERKEASSEIVIAAATETVDKELKRCGDNRDGDGIQISIPSTLEAGNARNNNESSPYLEPPSVEKRKKDKRKDRRRSSSVNPDTVTEEGLIQRKTSGVCISVESCNPENVPNSCLLMPPQNEITLPEQESVVISKSMRKSKQKKETPRSKASIVATKVMPENTTNHEEQGPHLPPITKHNLNTSNADCGSRCQDTKTSQKTRILKNSNNTRSHELNEKTNNGARNDRGSQKGSPEPLRPSDPEGNDSHQTCTSHTDGKKKKKRESRDSSIRDASGYDMAGNEATKSPKKSNNKSHLLVPDKTERTIGEECVCESSSLVDSNKKKTRESRTQSRVRYSPDSGIPAIDSGQNVNNERSNNKLSIPPKTEDSKRQHDTHSPYLSSPAVDNAKRNKRENRRASVYSGNQNNNRLLPSSPKSQAGHSKEDIPHVNLSDSDSKAAKTIKDEQKKFVSTGSSDMLLVPPTTDERRYREDSPYLMSSEAGNRNNKNRRDSQLLSLSSDLSENLSYTPNEKPQDKNQTQTEQISHDTQEHKAKPSEGKSAIKKKKNNKGGRRLSQSPNKAAQVKKAVVESSPTILEPQNDHTQAPTQSSGNEQAIPRMKVFDGSQSGTETNNGINTPVPAPLSKQLKENETEKSTGGKLELPSLTFTAAGSDMEESTGSVSRISYTMSELTTKPTSLERSSPLGLSYDKPYKKEKNKKGIGKGRGDREGNNVNGNDEQKSKNTRRRKSTCGNAAEGDTNPHSVDQMTGDIEQSLDQPTDQEVEYVPKKNRKSISDNPTVTFYFRVCKKVGVLPLRKVLQQFGRAHMTFKNLTLTTRDMKALCLSLQKETTASSLDFTGNFMQAKETGYVLAVLSRLHTVFQVSVCNNCLHGQGISDLSRFLLTNDFLTRLDVSGNKLTDQDAPYVTAILKVNTTLKTLLLNHNEFREEGGILIGEALVDNSTLEDIDLSWNHLRRCGAIGIAKGLEQNTALRAVNLAWNGFGFEGCVAIGDMMCTNTTITELDLTYNRIGPAALLELLRGISGNKTLRIFKMGYNPITAAFSSLILLVVQKHRETALENIDLAGVVVDKEFVSLLEEIQRDRFFIVNYEVSLPVKKMSREEMREKIGLPTAYNVDPLRMLYLLKEKMRASDFFYKINKDNDDGLQRDELYELFEEAGLPVTTSVIDKIMEFMDTNGDGTIDLGEFLQGDKRIKTMSRKHLKDQQERRAKDGNYNKYSRTFQKANVDPLSVALKTEPNSSPARLPRKGSFTRHDSDINEDGHHPKPH